MANFTEGIQKLPYFNEEDIPQHKVSLEHADIDFLLYGKSTEFRVRTLMTKEPETIRWIDSFKAGEEVLWDIGANVGIFSCKLLALNIEFCHQ